MHGEYFSQNDAGKDYLLLVHRKIMSYFNEAIFDDSVINLGVIHPQRHFWGNLSEASFYIRSKAGKPLTIKGFLSDVKTTDLNNLKNYEFVYEDNLTKDY